MPDESNLGGLVESAVRAAAPTLADAAIERIAELIRSEALTSNLTPKATEAVAIELLKLSKRANP